MHISKRQEALECMTLLPNRDGTPSCFLGHAGTDELRLTLEVPSMKLEKVPRCLMIGCNITCALCISAFAFSG